MASRRLKGDNVISDSAWFAKTQDHPEAAGRIRALSDEGDAAKLPLQSPKPAARVLALESAAEIAGCGLLDKGLAQFARSSCHAGDHP